MDDLQTMHDAWSHLERATVLEEEGRFEEAMKEARFAANACPDTEGGEMLRGPLAELAARLMRQLAAGRG
jgi:hypothetical protein